MQGAQRGARKDDVDRFDGEVLAKERIGRGFGEVWDNGGDLMAIEGDKVAAFGKGLLQVCVHFA